MDDLSTLPVVDGNVSPEEEEVMSYFFGPTEKMSFFKELNWKIIIVLGGLFLAFANPWVGKLLSLIPGISNSFTAFAIQAAVFLIAMVLVMAFV